MKNTIKKLIFAIFMLFLIIIVGCDSGTKSKTPITDVDVRKGIDGLIMEFTKNAPPARVFEDSIFPIAVNLKNKGASDIEKEKGIIVFGFEKAYVDVGKESDERQQIDIKGKSVFNPDGDEDFITINAKAKKIGEQSETHPSTILATACYPYKTVFGSSACVDTDIYGLRKGEKACSIRDLEFANGQGAPVTITKVETRMLPDVDEDKVKPHFIIHIENKGNGEVIKSDKIEVVCTSDKLEYTDFNTVEISASLSGKELDCSIGEGIPETTIRLRDKKTTIRLRDKKDTVRCTLRDGIDRNLGAYTSPLRIELDYGYTFTISKDIIIEKILGY